MRPGYPADGKLQPGDRIAAANGKPVEGWWDIEDAVAEGPATAALSVERGTETLAVELPRGDGARLADTLGIAPRPVYVVASLQQDLPLKVGDPIVKIGHNEVANALKEQLLYTPLDDMLTVMAMSGSVTVRRGDVDTEVQLQPGTKRGVGQVGISPVIANALHKESFFGSFVPALKSTASISTLAFVVLGKLFSRDIPVSELMGPVGIIQTTYISATRGISDFFWLVHLITVNIGVFNLLPVPPLDGGRIVMLAYEKVRGRQPSRRMQEAILLAGVGVVLLIFVVATFNDLRRIFF